MIKRRVSAQDHSRRSTRRRERRDDVHRALPPRSTKPQAGSRTPNIRLDLRLRRERGRLVHRDEYVDGRELTLFQADERRTTADIKVTAAQSRGALDYFKKCITGVIRHKRDTAPWQNIEIPPPDARWQWCRGFRHCKIHETSNQRRRWHHAGDASPLMPTPEQTADRWWIPPDCSPLPD